MRARGAITPDDGAVWARRHRVCPRPPRPARLDQARPLLGRAHPPVRQGQGFPGYPADADQAAHGRGERPGRRARPRAVRRGGAGHDGRGRGRPPPPPPRLPERPPLGRTDRVGPIPQMILMPPVRSERPALLIQASTIAIGCGTMDTTTSGSSLIARAPCMRSVVLVSKAGTLPPPRTPLTPAAPR